MVTRESFPDKERSLPCCGVPLSVFFFSGCFFLSLFFGKAADQDGLEAAPSSDRLRAKKDLLAHSRILSLTPELVLPVLRLDCIDDQLSSRDWTGRGGTGGSLAGMSPGSCDNDSGDLSLSVESVTVEAFNRASEKGASKSSRKRGLRVALRVCLKSGFGSGMAVLRCNSGLKAILSVGA
jgi:hypothetical protein